MTEYKYYVYAYIRLKNSKTAKAGTPYYIGKGCGDRAYQKHNSLAKTPNDNRRIVMLETNLSEIGSYAIERRFISWWGKTIDKTGILYNILDGGEGSSGLSGSLNGMFGKTHTAAAREIMRLTMLKGNNHMRRWFNDGYKNKYEFECPLGFVVGRIVQPTTKGRFWFNDGIIQVSKETKPLGDEWVGGMLPKKRKPPKEKIYKDMSGCAGAKCSITGRPLGRIHKSDHRWSVGEICGIKKNINIIFNNNYL